MYCSICQKETPRLPFLTGGRDYEYGVPGVWEQTACAVCGLVATTPMPSMDEILSYYPKSYHGYQSAPSRITRFLVTRNLRARAKLYRALIGPDARILDVGSADGAHFDTWQEVEPGWALYGFEFNDGAAAAGRAEGRRIATATIESYQPPVSEFQLIIMNHLLEHVRDPFDTTARVYALLASGGSLVGEVPNIRSWDFSLFGRFWGGCHWPRHVHQFTPATMSLMLTKTGFSDVQISYQLHTGHWALSVQNWLQSHRLTRVTLSNGRAWYYPLLLIAFVPVNLVAQLFGMTGIIGFSARKP